VFGIRRGHLRVQTAVGKRANRCAGAVGLLVKIQWISLREH
jgi:hypothetical protein